jgi:PPOX class probable F420-dependent enzyme
LARFGDGHAFSSSSLRRHAYGEGMPLEPEERRRFTDARVARLATTRPDGRPHVVPITFALRRETIVTAVDQKPKTTKSPQRLKNIAAQPAASVLVDHYEDDWSQLWWIRADGTARVVAEGTEWQESVEVLTKSTPNTDGTCHAARSSC